MGRFYAIVVLLAAAACGDNLVPGTQVNPSPSTAGTVGNLQPTTYQLPEVCGSMQWTNLGNTADVRVTVASGGSSLAMLATPTSGGTLTGYTFDTAAKASLSTEKVPLPYSSSAVGASLVGQGFVVAASDGTDVHVTQLDPTLQKYIELAKLPGTLVAEQGVLTADGQQVVPVAGDAGVTLQAFDASWQPTTTASLATTSGITGLTATQLGSAMLLGWSTASECDLGVVYGVNTTDPGHVSTASYPCRSPRLAANTQDLTASLVFEAPDGIRLMHVSHMQMGGGSQLLRPQATSPRVLFDGTRTWVSFVDLRGDVAVGFIVGDNQYVSTSLPGVQPGHDGYELVMFDGAPWVVALDASGYTAHRLCVAQQ